MEYSTHPLSRPKHYTDEELMEILEYVEEGVNKMHDMIAEIRQELRSITFNPHGVNQ